MSIAEMSWLRDYHQEVWNAISPMLDDEDRQWLWEKCQLPGVAISA
jgi:Xaa-Pro aminopeptidase